MALPRTSIKVTLPVPSAPNVQLVGTLEVVRGGGHQPISSRKPIALILHGAVGHKDYLFLKRLAKTLPIDSFRFDFRGNHESTGPPLRIANFADDLEDLQAVIRHLVDELNYTIEFIMGHSRGTFIGFKWVCSQPEGSRLAGFVNVSGRFRMQKLLEVVEKLKPSFEQHGYHERNLIVARKSVTVRSYEQDYLNFANWDTSYFWKECPPDVHVLSIHGLDDEVVPVYDALIWADALSNRSTGTHNLHLIEHGDHNLNGHHEEVVSVIMDWMKCLDDDKLKDGVWSTGLRPKPKL